MSQPSLLHRMVSFVRAITSGRDSKLQAERDEICRGCDQYHERPVKSISGKWRMEAHCKACGCGAKRIADITRGKHAWVNMTCPQNKWPGDQERTGISLKQANALFGARDRCEYNLASVQSLIDRSKPMGHEDMKLIYGKEVADQWMQREAQENNNGQRLPDKEREALIAEARAKAAANAVSAAQNTPTKTSPRKPTGGGSCKPTTNK